MASEYSTPGNLTSISLTNADTGCPPARPKDLREGNDDDSVDLSGSIEITREKSQSSGKEHPSSVAALTQVVSRVISARPPVENPGPPPDAGVVAWTQVAMCHLVVFNTWGYINSFGVFQTYYTASLNVTPSAISWVGSVQIFLLFFIGTLSGRATDAGYFRHTLALGSILQLVGVFTTSLSGRYWQIFLSQGVCTGLGNGMVFCPALSLLATYFRPEKRSLAIAIGAAGTGTGGLVFPAIAQQLLPRVGFAWTVRVIGFVMLGTMSAIFALARPRLGARKAGPLVEWTALKELPFTLFSVGMFFVFWGLYFAFYYVGSFGRNVIDVSEKDAISLLLILNGAGIVGRIAPAILADMYFGPLNTLIPFTLISGVLLYIWAAVSSRGGLIAFAAIYGIFAAGIQSLFPATASSLTKDLNKMGVRIGMVFTLVSFASLTGAPLAGELIERKGGDYLYAQVFAGSSIIVGFVTLVGARLADSGFVFRKVL
ncbi:MAG: hypothetical protein M1812_000937 [Candelaria pacifica]|nr:MAG: hypothetical protein M1812_000937 [Candelaria pacifica]